MRIALCGLLSEDCSVWVALCGLPSEDSPSDLISRSVLVLFCNWNGLKRSTLAFSVLDLLIA